jgi:uncharacterized membrane protein YheB (UPF0754 family)
MALFISVIGGALVGWITNSIAVNMLFKKFFGRWGGVIENSYKELIQNLSRLVEQKLINTHTLRDEMKKPAFNGTLLSWIRNILQKELPAKTENMRFKEIAGFDETVSRLADYLSVECKSLIKNIVEALDGIELQNILSEEAYRYLVERNTGKIFADDTDCKKLIGTALTDFFSRQQINSLCSANFIEQIKKNINGIIEKTDFTAFDGDIDKCLEKITEKSGIIESIEKAAREISLSDFMGDSDNTALFNYVADFTESGRGKDLPRSVIAKIIDEAESLDTGIASIFKPELIENIAKFIERHSPEVTDRLILFVEGSRDEIDRMIVEAAGEHFRGKANSMIQGILFGTVSSQISFSDKIIEMIKQNRKEICQMLNDLFMNYIHNMTIGGIVSQLKKNENFNPEHLADMISRKLRNLPSDNPEIVKTIMAIKLKALAPDIDLALVAAIKTKLLPRVFDEFKKTVFHKTENGKLSEKVNAFIDSLAAKHIGDVIDINAMPINENSVKRFMLRLWPLAAKSKIHPRFTDDFLNMKLVFENMAEHIKERNINDACGVLRNETVYAKFADTAQAIISGKLDVILSGGVFDIAKSELSVLSPQEINGMVQNFMGRQLKPINIIGAVLGGIAGALTATAASFFNAPQVFTWQLFVFYGIVFALAGIGTNWIAVRMLFRPYKRIFGLNFPPFVGVAASKQGEFAKSTAKLVRENMLNESALRRFYGQKKALLALRCKQGLIDTNYSFIDEFFAEEGRVQAISNGTFDSLAKIIKASNMKIAEYIDGYIAKRLSVDDTANITVVLRDALIQKLRSGALAGIISEKIQDCMAKKKLSEYNISAVIDSFLNNMDADLSGLIGRLNAYEAKYDEYIENHSLNDLRDNKPADKAGEYQSEKFGALMREAAHGITLFLGACTIEMRQSPKTCFGGIIPILVKSNSGHIIDAVCKMAAKHEQVIADKIIGSIGGTSGSSLFGMLKKQAVNLVMRNEIEAIVEIVIEKKLPTFLTAKQESFLGVIDGALEHGFDFDSEVFDKDNLNTAIQRIFTAAATVETVNRISAAFLNEIGSAKLKSLLAALNIHSGEELLKRASPLIDSAFLVARERLSDKTTRAEINTQINSVLKKILGKVSTSELLRGINIEAEARLMSDCFFNDGTVLDHIGETIDAAAQKILGDKDFYRHDLFQKDISAFITAGFDENDAVLRGALVPFLNKTFRNINTLITPEAKCVIICDCIVDAIFESADGHIPGLVNAISVDTVVEREINAMSAQEIEELFYGFAGEYFKKIILYGWIGSLGGLLSYALGG